MPLPAYGVVIGTLARYEREPPDNFGKYFHGFVYVNAPLGEYKCAVDVATPAGIMVQYRQLHGLDPNLFASISAFPSGWHRLAANAQSGALDYIRSPILNKLPQGCLTFVYSAWATLLNNLFKSYQDSGWITSDGEKALDAMETLFSNVARIYIFGAPFDTGLGVHDIHMNQGDPPGIHQANDGIWQDGAVITETSGGTLNCFLVKFATQSLHTDDRGLPVS